MKKGSFILFVLMARTLEQEKNRRRVKDENSREGTRKNKPIVNEKHVLHLVHIPYNCLSLIK